MKTDWLPPTALLKCLKGEGKRQAEACAVCFWHFEPLSGSPGEASPKRIRRATYGVRGSPLEASGSPPHLMAEVLKTVRSCVRRRLGQVCHRSLAPMPSVQLAPMNPILRGRPGGHDWLRIHRTG